MKHITLLLLLGFTLVTFGCTYELSKDDKAYLDGVKASAQKSADEAKMAADRADSAAKKASAAATSAEESARKAERAAEKCEKGFKKGLKKH
ncbi:MAG: hypothetical protein HQK88_13675 [Nitrospirae bacterium]|nr:hypothetical protein [Nitrospirota bacterium]MBF0536485.1 hypothetical protein [Nitrospirota bacterium]MBF0617853.1 hypothetical protein [Nitrospirota bacterium]